MTDRLRRILATFCLLLALGWSHTAAIAQDTGIDTETIGGSGDNVAVAISTKDGSSTFKVSFRIVRTSADVIDQSNVAFAFSSCEGCRSVAIAFQVVLVGSTPSTVIPENFAIALNFECIDCATLASAYQFVLGTDGNVHFSPEGNQALSEIRRAVQSLARSELPVDELQAELDLLADDLRRVLAEELVASGPEDAQVQEVEETGATPTPTETPTGETSPTVTTDPTSDPSSTPDPGTSGTPDQSPSPTSSPSPSPSSSPSPTVSASA